MFLLIKDLMESERILSRNLKKIMTGRKLTAVIFLTLLIALTADNYIFSDSTDTIELRAVVETEMEISISSEPHILNTHSEQTEKEISGSDGFNAGAAPKQKESKQEKEKAETGAAETQQKNAEDDPEIEKTGADSETGKTETKTKEILIGTITERSNSSTGYTVTVVSDNNSRLANSDNTHFVLYTINYGTLVIDLSSGSALIVDTHSSRKFDSITRELRISYRSDSIRPDSYTDTLTFIMSAN